MSRHVTFMTIDDASHYTPEQRAEIIAAYPEHEREARAKGIPVLGSGRIFPISEELVACEPFKMPRFWPRLGALDFGWDHPSAAVELAWDTKADVIYETKAQRASQQTPAMQVITLKPWGSWLPWARPCDGRRDTLEGAGIALAKQYEAAGLNMLPEHARFADKSVLVEAGLMEMLGRMRTGRFRVSNTLLAKRRSTASFITGRRPCWRSTPCKAPAYVVELDGKPEAAFGAAQLRYGLWTAWSWDTRRIKRCVPRITQFFWEVLGPDVAAQGAWRCEDRALASNDPALRWLHRKRCHVGTFRALS